MSIGVVDPPDPGVLIQRDAHGHFAIGALNGVPQIDCGDFEHAFQSATSNPPARMLIFDAPAHAGDFFRDVDREVKEMPRDAVKMPEIGARHGIRFIR